MFVHVKDLISSIASLEHRSNVVICTVLKRVHGKHSNNTDFNALIVNSIIRYLKLRREVSNSTCFKDDGVHLNNRRLQQLACAFNKGLRDYKSKKTSSKLPVLKLEVC